MSPQLTVHNAQINTATVEVKTLTISGRQVTLAVFRQLQEKELIDLNNTSRFNGVPWGTVNYCSKLSREARKKIEWGYGEGEYDGINSCDSLEFEHLHVVWQCGTSLYRSLVPSPDWLCAADPIGTEKSWDHGWAREYRDRWEELKNLPQLFIAVLAHIHQERLEQ